MNIQFLIVICCLLAAVVYIAYKIFISLLSKGAPACSGCPKEKSCAGIREGCTHPRALQELRPKK